MRETSQYDFRNKESCRRPCTKAQAAMHVQLYEFLTLAREVAEWPASRSAGFIPAKEPSIPIEQEAVWAP